MSLPIPHGRGTRNLAVRQMLRNVFAFIKRRLRIGTTASTTIVGSTILSARNANSKRSVPVLLSGEESGYFSTPTTPSSSSKPWDGTHLLHKYGIKNSEEETE